MRPKLCKSRWMTILSDQRSQDFVGLTTTPDITPVSLCTAPFIVHRFDFQQLPAPSSQAHAMATFSTELKQVPMQAHQTLPLPATASIAAPRLTIAEQVFTVL